MKTDKENEFYKEYKKLCDEKLKGLNKSDYWTCYLEACRARQSEIDKKEQEIYRLNLTCNSLIEQRDHLNDLNYEIGENLKASEDQNHYFQLMSKYRDENYLLKAELDKARELIKDLVGHGEAIIQFPHKEKVSLAIVMEKAKEFLKIKEGE